jgi:hypothetical protein
VARLLNRALQNVGAVWAPITNKTTLLYYLWGVQHPLKSPSPGPGIDP